MTATIVDNFPWMLQFTLKEEGGYSDDPNDYGGATNYGITQGEYNRYRYGKGLPARSVAYITVDEYTDIYRTGYYNLVGGPNFNKSLSCVLFDYAVNCGVSRSVKTLQGLVGVTPDGVCGHMTINEVLYYCSKGHLNNLIASVLENRKQYYLAIVAYDPSQKVFEADWLGRVSRNAQYVGVQVPGL